MPSTQSYIFKNVTFLLDGDDDYRCQVTKAELVPDVPVTITDTLCGPQSAAGTAKWTLQIEGLQNFFTYSSLVMYLNSNAGKEASFRITWPSPDGTDNIVVAGTAILVAAGFGGTAEEVATFSVELPVQGQPTFTRTVGS